MIRQFVVILLAAAVLSGCASNSEHGVSRAIGDTAATLGGAAVGYVASDGNTLATVGGAAAGLAVKKYADHLADKAEKKKLQDAYDTAHAQATRDLYDAIQRQQSEPVAASGSGDKAPQDDAVYLPTQIPERTVNGVIIDSSVEYIRLADTPPSSK
jgi:hypothetical protein